MPVAAASGPDYERISRCLPSMDFVNLTEMLAAARLTVPEVTPAALVAASRTFVDVREPHEVALGSIPGAEKIPRGLLETSVDHLSHDQPIVAFCAVGERSLLAGVTLQEMGFTNVVSLAGGFVAWQAAGHPWEIPQTLSVPSAARYSRHIALPEVGVAGQQKLLDARIAIIGAGGLGSPAALYLAAAGVGTLAIFDADRVDVSNLQRQILHGTDRIGQSKASSAERTIANLNPDVAIEAHAVNIVASNALELLAGFDLIVDGADNFPTRYLINDVSQHVGIPVVHGSIFRFEGQVAVFDPNNGPCYRCLFPHPPPPELAPNCQEAGVLGVLPGVIGSLQATEAIKLIIGIGTPLRGRLLTYDALTQETFQLRIAKDPNCPSCGSTPPAIVDYDETCLVRQT